MELVVPSGRGKRPAQGAPVVDRALRLLSAFTDRRRALTLSELARRAELPVATASRLAARLEAWGALERRDDGRYVVGIRLWEVGSLAPRGPGVREAALPYLQDLHAIVGDHVLLAVRDGLDAVLLERLSARGAPPVAYRVGGRVPLRTTAVGRVLLAAADAPTVERVLAAPSEREPGGPDDGGEQLAVTLRRIRLDGVSVVRRRSPSATVAVAAPVRTPDGIVHAAISVVAPDGTRGEALAAAVRTVAASVARSVDAVMRAHSSSQLRPGRAALRDGTDRAD